MSKHYRFAHAEIGHTQYYKNRAGDYGAEQTAESAQNFDDFMPRKAMKLVIQ